MKTILFLMMTMVFTLTLGVIYASADMHNGVTDFTGRHYDNLEISPVAVNSVEGASAGGLRESDKELSNGVTDFTGRHYDNQEIVPAAAPKSVGSESAGGLRKGPESKKAPLDFGTGRNYDTIPMNPALGW